MYIEALPRWLVLGLGAVVIVFANLRGGQDVRVVAAVITMYVVFDFAHLYDPFVGMPNVLVAFAACLGCALTSRRWWTIWAAASALLAWVTEVLWAARAITEWAYYSAQVTWFMVLLAAVVVGAATRPASRG